MFSDKSIKITCLVIGVLVFALIASKNSSFGPTSEQRQAQDYETKLYLASPDGKKMAARMVLGQQFPGWCRWSEAEMIVRSNGDVYARCNGATFGVDTTRLIAIRSINKS